MKRYCVLYKWRDKPADPPLAFVCSAEDVSHAEEQCENAYPECGIVWAYVHNKREAVDDLTLSQIAYDDYWFFAL